MGKIDILEAVGIDRKKGGTYNFPDDTTLHLRGYATPEDFGDDNRSAYIDYFILRMRELNALEDKVREIHTKIFSVHLRKALKKYRD